jgi:pSer/pThr/pTyr-binding forkhead associated (FHA) protein
VQDLELWNQLVPDDALRNTISREHFRLRVDRTKLTLHNLSGGGTSVNGTVVNETLLRIGDVIGIGNQNPVNGGEMRPVLHFKVC